MCPIPRPLQPLAKGRTEAPFKSVLNYTCDAGWEGPLRFIKRSSHSVFTVSYMRMNFGRYVMLGANESRCLHDATWSNPPPLCKGTAVEMVANIQSIFFNLNLKEPGLLFVYLCTCLFTEWEYFDNTATVFIFDSEQSMNVVYCTWKGSQRGKSAAFYRDRFSPYSRELSAAQATQRWKDRLWQAIYWQHHRVRARLDLRV